MRRRGRRAGLTALAVVLVAVAAILDHQSPFASTHTGPSSSTAAPPAGGLGGERRRLAKVPGDLPGGGGELGEADGAVPDGASVFDDAIPGVAKLDSDLLGALRQAASDAAGDGVEFVVDSGWRSPEYQDHLLRQAVSEYGSAEEAARWVATPETSAHVSGDAVDVGPAEATEWLSAHGSRYGLCQIYGNEPWHYELRPDAVENGCPSMYADPTQDPRMRR